VVLDETLDAVAKGDPGEPQDESLARDCPVFEPEWRYIDWSNPSRMIHNQVRSWMGARDIPRGAFATLDGERLVVTRTRLVPEAANGGIDPGTVLTRNQDEIVVQCGDGAIRIIAWEPVEPQPNVVDAKAAATR
jgi:methionyl-tRNA formyltransferase